MTTLCGKQFLRKRIINDAKQHLFPFSHRQRNGAVTETVNQIGRTIHRDSRYQQDHPHTGYSNLRNQPTTDIISVHTSQINEGILIMIHKGKSEEYGEPDQQECAADKPYETVQ